MIVICVEAHDSRGSRDDPMIVICVEARAMIR